MQLLFTMPSHYNAWLRCGISAQIYRSDRSTQSLRHSVSKISLVSVSSKETA